MNAAGHVTKKICVVFRKAVESANEERERERERERKIKLEKREIVKSSQAVKKDKAKCWGL